jgi:beta-N-acetylhexosaminidase
VPGSLLATAATAWALGVGGIGGDASALPLEQAVGQRVIASLPGTALPDPLARAIRHGRVAGVILFARNIASRAQLRALTERMQLERRRGPRALRDLPLLVLIDQEGGLVKRLPGPPRRSPAELGRLGDPALARAEGLATARSLRRVGVNVNLAPVLDVGLPGSSVRALGRTYGATARRVAALGGAFAAGLASGGVLACAKHFPGLGRALANQDERINRIDASLAALRRSDEAPFRAAARDGITLTMVSSAIYPALAARPALFAPRIATRELRAVAGFAGTSISDDLETASLAHLAPERKALAAARAGVDLLLFAQSAAAAARGSAALVRAVRAGKLSRTVVDAGADRVLALRQALQV